MFSLHFYALKGEKSRLKKYKGGVIDSLCIPIFAIPKESGASWKREDAVVQCSNSDPCTGAEMDWLEPGGSTLSPKSLGVSWFFLPACDWLSHHRSAMAADKYFLGRRQPSENNTINSSQIKQDLPRPSWGEGRVCGTQTEPKTWRQKQNISDSFSNIHLPRHLEFWCIFPPGFPYPHKLFLSAWNLPGSPSNSQKGQGGDHQVHTWVNTGKKRGSPALALVCTILLMPNSRIWL